jgi:hypothetical protein
MDLESIKTAVTDLVAGHNIIANFGQKDDAIYILLNFSFYTGKDALWWVSGITLLMTFFGIVTPVLGDDENSVRLKVQK